MFVSVLRLTLVRRVIWAHEFPSSLETRRFSHCELIVRVPLPRLQYCILQIARKHFYRNRLFPTERGVSIKPVMTVNEKETLADWHHQKRLKWLKRRLLDL